MFEIAHLALRKGIAQSRHQSSSSIDGRYKLCVGFYRAINDTVQHVLNTPSQLANGIRLNDASAALEGMKGATYLGERIGVVEIGHPLRQIFLYVAEHLVDFLNKDFNDLFVRRLQAFIWHQPRPVPLSAAPHHQ